MPISKSSHLRQLAVVSHPSKAAACGADAAGPHTGDECLVRDCLEGGEGAWERLYHHCHPSLLRTIRALLREEDDSTTADEIAARVWFALVRDDFRLLASFDSSRNVRLTTFLAGLARIEFLRFYRSERRRISRESRAGRRTLRRKRASLDVGMLMDDFAQTLTDAERELLEADLAPPSATAQGPLSQLSNTAIYQRRHRIREKLRSFLRAH